MFAGFEPDSIKGSGVQAYAPSYVGTKTEKWNFILCEPTSNQVTKLHFLADTLAYLFIHSLVCSLARSLTHSLTHSLPLSLIYSLTYSLTHSLTFSHLRTYLCTHFPTTSLAHALADTHCLQAWAVAPTHSTYAVSTDLTLAPTLLLTHFACRFGLWCRLTWWKLRGREPSLCRAWLKLTRPAMAPRILC